MRSAETVRLPISTPEYDMNNEQVARRSVEQAFQDLRNDVIEVRDTADKPSSLALRRHQFLLMGA